MKRYEFIVPGPLMGYRQTTWKTIFHKKERARSKAYGQYKKNVLLLSLEAGAPNMGKAVKEWAPKLSVHVFWRKEPRIDFSNVFKAIEDGVWYEDDRYVTPGKLSGVTWDFRREEALVIIELP